MNQRYKLTISLFALALSAFVSLAANAQVAANYQRVTTPPKVVFVGDYITAQWASAFAANPNWINQGEPTPGAFGTTLASFQSDVVSLHPAIVHIMVGLTLVTSFLTRVHCSISRAL